MLLFVSNFKDLNLRRKTKSIWSLVLADRDEYLNALYVSAYQNHVILPIAALRHLELWTAYYCRWNPTFKAQVCTAFCVELATRPIRRPT